MTTASSCCYYGNAAASHAPTPSFSSSPQPRPKLSCQSCAARRLASQIARYRSAFDRRELAREDCLRRLSETPRLRRRPGDDDAPDDDEYQDEAPLPDPNRIHRRVSLLRRSLDDLRGRCSELAVRVAARTMENDEREGGLRSNSEKVRTARERLDRMRSCLLDDSGSGGGERKPTTADDDDDGGLWTGGGGLRDALLTGTREVRTLRFRLACRAFDMHRLDVGRPYSDEDDDDDGDDGDDGGPGRGGRDSAVPSNIGGDGATGVGRIGGLPLPHAGPVLYGVIPPAVLASSLRLVASLTQLVARCLGVVLPHPVLVCSEECRKCGAMYDYGNDVVDVLKDGHGCDDDGDDDDEGYHGGDDGRSNLCGACLNEGMSKTSPTESRPPQHSGSVPHSQERRRSSFLAIVGSSALKVVSMTTSATSRAITHMQQQSLPASTGAALPSGNHRIRRPPPGASSKGNNDDVPSAFAGSTEAVSMSPDSISSRINHASFAYLRESHDRSATEYVLNPPRWGGESSAGGAGGGRGGAGARGRDPKDGRGGDDAGVGKRRPPPPRPTYSNREEFHVAEERFATGLQLLQNDIVALCFRAGVDVSALWPAESVLLNLHSLWRHCRQMAEAGNIYCGSLNGE
jgi:hypothetical protein